MTSSIPPTVPEEIRQAIIEVASACAEEGLIGEPKQQAFAAEQKAELITLIATALVEAERMGIERAAKVCDELEEDNAARADEEEFEARSYRYVARDECGRLARRIRALLPLPTEPTP